MSTPKETRRGGKRKQPLHNTPPSGVAEKKTKGLSAEGEGEVCIVCDRIILEPSDSTEGEDAVFCEGNCQGWLHRTCAGLSRPAFDNLNESTPYLCSFCTFTLQYKEICDLKETVKTLTDKIAELEGTQQPQPGSINETPSVAVAPIATSSRTQPTASNQQSAPPERKLNVVVYGLDENPSNTTRQDRLQMDVKSVISAFSKLDSPPIDESSIKDCYRLGKYNAQASRPRPILVKFLRYTDASTILNNKTKLSKPVYVKPDLSAEERAVESMLLKERRCLIEKGVARQFIKIRNQSLFVLNKLHAKVQNKQLQLVNAATIVQTPQDDTPPEQASN